MPVQSGTWRRREGGRAVALELGLGVSLGTRAEVTVAGELDAFAAPQLEAEIGRLAAGGFVAITLDFAELAFVDSHGLAAIERLRACLRAHGGDVAIVNAPRHARRLAALLGFAFSPAPAAVETAAVG